MKKTENEDRWASKMIPQVKLVRVGRMSKGFQVSDSGAAFDFWKRVVKRQSWFDEDREVSIALLLDNKLRVKAWNLVSVGTEQNCIIDTKGVFRCAVACSANSVIVMHNHLSGECRPSKEDLLITRTLVQSGQVLGIRVEDHLIIGWKEYCSLRDECAELFYKAEVAAKMAAEESAGQMIRHVDKGNE